MRELAFASGLSVNNIRMIIDRDPGLLTNEYLAPGRGVSRTFPIRTLKRAACIYAVTKIGVGVTQAARVVAEFADEFESNHHGLHANTDALIDPEEKPDLVRDTPYDEHRSGNDWEYYFYILSLNKRADVPNRQTYPHDMIMEIIDQTYIFQTYTPRPKPLTRSEPPSKEAVLKMEGWERGGELAITLVQECGNNLKDWEREALKWQHVRENYTTRTMINVSLAIRDAFERIRLSRREA